MLFSSLHKFTASFSINFFFQKKKKSLPNAWLSLSRGSSSSSDEAIRPDELSLVRWTAHCQMCAVPSPEAVNTNSLVGWNLNELTLPAWPVYWSRAWPECMPQIMAVWSADAVPKMGNRIRDTETSQMPSRWPVYRRKGVQFNNAGGPVMIMYFVSNTKVVVTQCGNVRIFLPLRF